MSIHRQTKILLAILRSATLRLGVAVLVIGSCIALTDHLAPAASVEQEQPGLTTRFIAEADETPYLLITSSDRFELRLDAAGMYAWYDLQRDPARSNNLVEPAAHLLEHHLAPAEPSHQVQGRTETLFWCTHFASDCVPPLSHFGRGAGGEGYAASGQPVVYRTNMLSAPEPLQGHLALEEASPVHVRVVWSGQAGTPAQPFRLTYTIWADGQIAVATQSAAPVRTTLHLNPQSITGATLQTGSRRTLQNGTYFQEHMLYLDAWTGDMHTNLTQGSTPAALRRLPETATLLAQPVYDARQGAFLVQSQPEQAIRLELPDRVVLRSPRFILANWSAPDFRLRYGAHNLVAGTDYLAHWDATRQELILQYLHPVVTGTDQGANSFTFLPRAGEPALSLSLKERGQVRNLDNGQLWVDANLRYLGAQPDAKTDLDLFKIPYIQSSNLVTATATLQDAPADAGVRFVLSFKASATSIFPVAVQTDLSAPYEHTFTLPAYGEYRLEAYMLDAQQQPINQTPDDIVDPLGYGHILVTIGDSITAGKWGYTIDSDDVRYPVAACRDDLTANERSTDCRNFPQYDNKLLEPQPGEPTNFFTGYQVPLNDRLRTCQARDVPVFILNDGISGITSASVASRVAQYRDHIDKLGAGYVLLQVGTNDANEGVSATNWRSNMDKIIDDLQMASQVPDIWIARLPPRYDREDIPAVMERIEAYNALVGDLAADQGENTREGPDFAALFAGQVFTEDGSELMNRDKLHPNIAGLNRMAEAWQTPVCAVLPASGDAPVPLEPISTATSTATSTPTATPTATATPTGAELYLPLLRR